MPQHANANIAARDTSLTGLAMLLDPALLAAGLREANRQLEIDDLQVRYVRYKPGRRCLVAYSGSIDGIAVDFYAKALADSTWHRRAQRHCDHSSMKNAQAAWPNLALALPASRILIWPPHCDARLPVISRLADVAALPQVVRSSLGSHAPRDDLQLERLVHKPERRFVGRLHHAKFSAAIKCYTPEAYGTARRNAKGIRRGKLFHVPEAIGRSRRHHFMILPWVAGRLLREALWQHTFSAMDVERTGGALAEFHGQRSNKLGPLSPQTEAQRLRSACDDIGFLLPQLARRISVVGDWAAERLLEMSPRGQATHGDFYSKQVIIASDRVVMLDLDEAHLGDPLADVANFLAHVETYVLRGRIDRAAADAIAVTLVEGYQHVAGECDEARLKTRVVDALLRLTHAPFRNGEVDWAGRIETALERIEQLVGELGGPRATAEGGPGQTSELASSDGVTITDPFHISHDSALAFLHDALDARAIERTIGQSLASDASPGTSWRLNSAEVVRHKVGRRCLIQYDLTRAADEQRFVCLGKVRAKGLDRATYELHRQLHEAGFQAGQSVSVPEALVCVPRWRMWLQRKSAARALDASQLQAGGAELGEQIVDAIDQLHRANIPSRRQHTLADELDILRQRFELLSADLPALSPRLERLLAGCETLASDLTDAPMCGVHRDFYQDHVLVDGQRMVLVDLDLYCLGDPAMDIGNFIGHLVELSLRTSGSPLEFVPTNAAMLDRFEQLSGKPARHRAQGYTTLTVARHVELCRRFPDRRHLMLPLLALCEERIGHAQRVMG